MQEFRKLDIWHEARALSVKVYQFTVVFPHQELFGLTSQIRRAVVSIGLNIAEGCGRSSSLEFCRFLEIALSSANEVEAGLLLSEDLGFVPPGSSVPIQEKVIQLKKMICGLLRRVRKP